MSRKLSQNQKTFNKVARHLLRQQAQSSENGTCLYRGPNGLRCAAGVLISNKKYKKSIESKTVDTPLVAPIIRAGGHDVNFVRKLQRIHDQHDPHEWNGLLQNFAREHGLKMPKV